MIWSSWISRLLAILIARYSQLKRTTSFVSYCFSWPTFTHISGTKCPILRGFSAKCSLYDVVWDHVENSKLNVTGLRLILLNPITYATCIYLGYQDKQAKWQDHDYNVHWRAMVIDSRQFFYSLHSTSNQNHYAVMDQKKMKHKLLWIQAGLQIATFLSTIIKAQYSIMELWPISIYMPNILSKGNSGQWGKYYFLFYIIIFSR